MGGVWQGGRGWIWHQVCMGGVCAWEECGMGGVWAWEECGIRCAVYVRT